MSYGYIEKIIIHPSVNTHAIARYCKKTPAEYAAGLQVGINDVEKYRDDVAVTTEHCPAYGEFEMRLHFHDSAAPEGPYEVCISLRAKERPAADENYRFHSKSLVLSFSAAGASEVFFEYEVAFASIRNAVNRYNRRVVGTMNEISPPRSPAEIMNIVYADMNREEGHEGIAASPFPQFRGRGRRHPSDPPAPFDIPFDLACRFFSLFRAIFPKGPPDDWKFIPTKVAAGTKLEI